MLRDEILRSIIAILRVLFIESRNVCHIVDAATANTPTSLDVTPYLIRTISDGLDKIADVIPPSAFMKFMTIFPGLITAVISCIIAYCAFAQTKKWNKIIKEQQALACINELVFRILELDIKQYELRCIAHENVSDNDNRYNLIKLNLIEMACNYVEKADDASVRKTFQELMGPYLADIKNDEGLMKEISDKYPLIKQYYDSRKIPMAITARAEDSH